MKKIILLKGLPASGKSTWAKEEVIKGNGNIKRINKDDLRSMLDNGKWSKGNEKIILSTRDLMTEELLKEGKTVIIDDTNFAPFHETTLRNIALENGAEFEIKEFDVDIHECIERDKKRENPVGQKVIYDMYNKYLIKDEQFKMREFDPSLPKCIIVDIDGTLSQKGDRDIYDGSKVYLDSVIKPVKLIVDWAKTASCLVNVILLSGRDGQFKEVTESWLKDNKILYDNLYMRAEGDNRKDTIVKKELFEKHIKNKYNVLFAIDDRICVVDQRREMGIFTFDVNQTRSEF